MFSIVYFFYNSYNAYNSYNCYMDALLNVRQAAFILKVHPLTVRRYIRDKKLKAIKAAGNVRIKESDLNDFNKEYTPARSLEDQGPIIKSKFRAAVPFTTEDPFLRLKGRGASITLSG
jgi:excisionase family DNA binding protein